MSTIAKKRILVLEDEFLIALDLVDLVEDLGANVVGPAYRIPDAIRLAETQDIDAAILDVNINGDRSDDVARLLSDRSVPFIFATGYGDEVSADGIIVVPKPYSKAEIERALQVVLG